MCLNADDKTTENFWKSEELKDGTWCWAIKLFRVDSGSLVSPYQDVITKSGWVKSDRIDQKAGEDAEDDITKDYIRVHRGIHVIVQEGVTDLYHEETGPFVEVMVKCYKKDFVAASTDDREDEEQWNSYGGEAVFMKVFLPKSEHDRAIKEWNEALEAPC